MSAPAGVSGRLRRALKFAAPFRWAIVVITLLTIVVAAMNAAEPLVMKEIFDEFASERRAPALMKMVVVLATLAVLREVGNSVSNWLTWRVRLGIHFVLLEGTVGKLHRMPLRIQRSEGVGAIMTKLDRSIQGLIGTLTQLLFSTFPALLYLVMAVFVVVRMDWRLAIIVLLFTPLPAIAAALATPEQMRRESTLMERWAKIYSRFNEVLSGIVTVRSFAMEDAERKRFLTDVAAANDVVVRGVRLDSGFSAATNLVVAAARIAAVYAGGMFIVRGEVTVGTLVALLGYVGGLFGPVQSLTGIYQTVQRANAALTEIFAILDEPEHLADDPHALELREVHGVVEFDRVSFQYEGATRPLISDLTLTVTPGETIAVVGPSGSGKTTLMALLMRFYDPVAGAVRIDGHDVRRFKQTSVRRHIGVVLQDPLLFNDTLHNNIVYGKPHATAAEVEAAARAAHAHEFILRLPQGYQTPVGERGTLLSVGERQRITIARALIKDPRIVILDEATASLDAESEGLVQEALERLLAGRTTFVIAHRLATVVNADRIIVLKDGRIDEVGPHRELVRRGGYYAELVRRQTAGLIENEGEPLAA
ncbi:MAG TPA: ABC transporter ATP-binding protein [Acidobacteriota bacterium]|nr:ABC transporter ATP-binding protein [Acidobacteriota bacterium]